MAGSLPWTCARAKAQPIVAACLVFAALVSGVPVADRQKATRLLSKTVAGETASAGLGRLSALEPEGEGGRRPDAAARPPIAGASGASGASADDCFQVDASPDPHNTWKCLEVRASRIQGAGRGLFAACDLPARTLLGEYRGRRFALPEFRAPRWTDPGAHELEADRAYIWKVPKCEAPPGKLQVITRADEIAARRCSDRNGFVYVDAFPLDEPGENPMRFVNGVRWPVGGDRPVGGGPQENVDAFFSDDRVWYYTKAAVKSTEELIVDYGKSYWAESPGADSQDDFGSEWGDF